MGAAAGIIHFMNEYMAVTDPDRAGHVREGMELSVLRVPKNKIPLSSSVTDPSVYPIVEKALGMNFTDYALGRED